MTLSRMGRRTPLAALPALAAGLLLAACSSGPDVRSDFDPEADFGGYRTFSFVENPTTDGGEEYTTLVTRYLTDACQAQMESRGYERVGEGGDLLMNFHTNVENRQQVQTAPRTSVHMGYYDYRSSMYGGWTGYANDTYVTEYTQGTLNIDLVDATRNQLVWEGVVIGRLSKKDMEHIQTTVDSTVAVVFDEYPFYAGDPRAYDAKERKARAKAE